MFVVTKDLSQKYCLDKHNFVATKDVFCRDKHVFVETKMIIVAAPANDIRVAAHIPRESLKRLIKPSQAIYSETPNGVHETSAKEHLTNFTVVSESIRSMSSVTSCSRFTLI